MVCSACQPLFLSIFVHMKIIVQSFSRSHTTFEALLLLFVALLRLLCALCYRGAFSGVLFFVILVIFYSPIYLGQETAKGPFGVRVKLPPLYHTRWRLHYIPFFYAKRQVGYLLISIFTLGLTRLRIEPYSAVSVADALSTRPLAFDGWGLWSCVLSIFGFQV